MKLIILICLIFLTSFVHAENVSVSDAESALNNSFEIINELNGQGFSTTNPSDVYSEALLVFQQVAYAEILRNSSIPDSDPIKVKANSALRLVNWRNMSYENIFYYTDSIQKYKEDSYLILDSISALNTKITDYKKRGVNTSSSDSLLFLANQSFYKGQYEESFSLIEKTKSQLEIDMEQLSSVNILAENAKNFFTRYIYWIISIVLLITVITYFFVGHIKLNVLKKKISRMETEEKVLNDLTKKAQTERFKENKISSLVYNIRIKKYQERLGEIKKDLPVLKAQLKKKYPRFK